LHGKIYDITDYIDYHPGGLETLLPYAGKDITNAFGKIKTNSQRKKERFLIIIL